LCKNFSVLTASHSLWSAGQTSADFRRPSLGGSAMPEPKPFPDRSAPAPRRPKRELVPGQRALADGLELRSYDVGALPLLQRIVERMQLRRILSEHLPRDDSRLGRRGAGAERSGKGFGSGIA